MIVTLAGHVDHGKTALVHALTGVNTDRLKEEQARGLTIDLGFAYATLAEERIGFVDVPGHHRFIHNMIAGVASQQHALVVVAADDGIMPQTIEHTQILGLLGLESGTIVINKVDLVDRDRLATCRDAVNTWRSNSFLRDADVFEVAAPSMQGISQLSQHLVDVARRFHGRDSQKPFRLAIDRAFSLRGVGTIVTGTVASGSVAVGDEVFLSATGSRVRVRGVNVQGDDASIAQISDRCSLNIAGAGVSDARRGHWVLAPDCEFSVARVYANASILPDFPRTVSHWSSIHVYHLTDHAEARISMLEFNNLNAGEHGLVELHCNEPMHFKAGDRLILRDRDLARTLGGATVLAPVPAGTTRRRTTENIAFLKGLQRSLANNDLTQAFKTHASRGLVYVDEFARFFLCTHADLADALASSEIAHESDQAIATSKYDEIATAVQKILAEFHVTQPAVVGMTMAKLATELPYSESALQFTVDRLVAKDRLRFVAGCYALAEHHVQAVAYDADFFTKVEPMFDADQPVSLGDVAKQLNMPFREIEKTLRPMLAAKVLVQVNKNRYLTPSRLSELERIAAELAAVKPFTVREFRDASGLGRNTVIDVLEYFDRQRITQRRGDARVMLRSSLTSS